MTSSLQSLFHFNQIRARQLRLSQGNPSADPGGQWQQCIVVATVNSYILQHNLPDAELILFPESNHGLHFQFTDSFIEYLTNFVDR
jgi:hypothetical protein